ncbi:hypothetical protein RIF23_18010 [Lipingzhangella sp. LS1_29]|uniref:Acyltransferase 3 domain-containing protein n=1 Tax=Lipingzhangella rawalii TaxID=2055835 RepID=A0ABU2HA45_9ACTN|nr:acyltransferase family protein [Lipingzhangella rawalii]MDS1272187.1 hypothetical protein [Lipingzhangella rawalii]
MPVSPSAVAPPVAGSAPPETVRKPERPASASGPVRDAHLDNAKFVLIVLVFVGHAISPARDTLLAEAVYFWIYLFHMPAFVLICGYVSASFDGSARRVDRLITTVLAPYLIFWGVYVAEAHVAGRGYPESPVDPIWLTWFLVALFVWRISVPFWKRIRWPLAVAVAVSLAAATVSTGDALGISRILSLLPFFVLGLCLQPGHLEWLHQRWVQVLAVLVLLGTMVAAVPLASELSTEWVFWRASLADREVDLLPLGMAARTGFLVLAGVLTMAFLAVIPRAQTWFTQLGAYTMFVYLLHGLPIRIAEQLGWYEAVDGYAGLAANTVSAVVLSFVLCTPWVRRATGWLVEPHATWLHRRSGT